MSKGISEDAQIHISIAFLIKAMVAVAIVVGSWYQAQMKFAEHETRIRTLEDKITVLNASVEGMESQHIEELEETNRTLMQKLGLRK
tara:strand:- start:770 stop:1030 length:261 start_codon:yes stop_codon:yes gene_type:complete